jgi:hypothetical protein
MLKKRKQIIFNKTNLNSPQNIAQRIQPVWNGEATMYDSDSGKIEIQITITNNSNKEIKIEQAFLTIKKKGIRFFSFQESLIQAEDKFIPPGGNFMFIYDLKDFLKTYGEKRKFGFAFKGENTEIRTCVINMNQINSIIKSLYQHHF